MSSETAKMDDHNPVTQHFTDKGWPQRTAKRSYSTEWLGNKMAECIFPLNQPRNTVELKKVQWREKVITGIFMLMLHPFYNTCRCEGQNPAQGYHRRVRLSILCQELLHLSGPNGQPRMDSPTESFISETEQLFLLQLFCFVWEIVTWFQMSHFYHSPSFPWLFKEVWQQFETFISQLFLKHVTRIWFWVV